MICITNLYVYEDAFTPTEDKGRGAGGGGHAGFLSPLFACFPTAEHAGYVIPIEAGGTKGLLNWPLSACQTTQCPVFQFITLLRLAVNLIAV